MGDSAWPACLLKGLISELFNLVYLHLEDTGVDTMGPLANLTQLQELYLDGNQIQDISVLKEFKNLKKLVLTDNPLSHAAYNDLTVIAEQNPGADIQFDPKS